MSHVHTIFAHKKLVQCIVWHPATVTSESTPSPYASWLASASDNIQIVNVTTAGMLFYIFSLTFFFFIDIPTWVACTMY